MDMARQRASNIGKVLLVRRTGFDPTHHRTREEWVETVRSMVPMGKIPQTIRDLETGARVPDDPSTLAALEKAYRLKPGCLGEALEGGALTSDDGEHLYPPHGHPDFGR